MIPLFEELAGKNIIEQQKRPAAAIAKMAVFLRPILLETEKYKGTINSFSFDIIRPFLIFSTLKAEYLFSACSASCQLNVRQIQSTLNINICKHAFSVQK